jgi:hypothetical protein
MTGTSFGPRKGFRSLLTLSTLIACGAVPAAHGATPHERLAAEGGDQTRGQDRTAYQATDLIKRWKVIVSTTFEERRAYAEESVMDSIEVVISPGAVKAVQERATEQRLKTVDAAVRRFANAMVASGERSQNGSVVITEEAIDAGLKTICPVYPFCQS